MLKKIQHERLSAIFYDAERSAVLRDDAIIMQSAINQHSINC